MYSWGDGSRGQLALHLQDGETAVTEPREVNSLPEQVLQAACGENHTLFLTRKGKIWTCGQNTMGQLGIRKSKNRTSAAVLEGLGTVVAVACGQEHSLILCESGQMFAWGRGSEGQLGTGYLQKHVKPRRILIPFPPHMPLGLPVVQVACGNHHSLALTKGGDVFSWGKNTHGQLGLGKAVSLQPVPSHVCSLTGVPVIQVCAGGEYSLARSLSGSVYCCGANNAGQLGLNRVDERGRFTVCAVPAFRNIRVSSISCGEAHTVVLTMDGSVFTFGEGRHGQLGHNSTENELKPRRVEGLGGPAEDIACGSHHTLVLMSSGVLLAFGNGLKGQLGNRQTQDVLQPRPVQPTWSSDGDAAHAVRISSGWNVNFIHNVPLESCKEKDWIYKIDEQKLQEWSTLDPESKEAADVKRFSRVNHLDLFIKLKSCCKFHKLEYSSDSPVSIDLHAARQIFEHLQRIDWISQVIPFKPLVKNLFLTSSSMVATDIFLVLPECHLFHEDQNVINSVLPLARAVVSLPESSMKQLKEQWSCLELDFIKKHICMWKNALRFLLKSGLILQFNPNVMDILQVLKHIHNSYGEAAETVPAEEFYIKEIGVHQSILEDNLIVWNQWRNLEETPESPFIFGQFPFLLNLQSKIYMFNFAANMSKRKHTIEYEAHLFQQMTGMRLSEAPPPSNFVLRVSRSALAKDTFSQLKRTKHEDFQKCLVVHFVEDLEQFFVNKEDFFLHLFKELFARDSDMFMHDESGTLAWFPVKPKCSRKRYFMFGILCGLALYNHSTLYLPFPKALFKKLLDVKLSLEDLKELSPVLGRSLQYLLDYSDDDVENMDMYYCVNWNDVEVELDPGEPGKQVDSTNKHDFVSVYTDYVLNKSVERIFEEFKRGFFTVCDARFVKLFRPDELKELMVGKEDYDWEIFRQKTTYVGRYQERHPNIVTFWKVFEDLLPEEKKAFLLFVTGSDRVPILGMDQIRMKIQALPKLTRQHYPEALTCHTLFFLPNYRSQKTMKAKLIEVINHNRGFWMD